MWILHTNSRIIHGQWFYSLPSGFSELPSENIISNSDTNANYFSLDHQNNILENNNTYIENKKLYQKVKGFSSKFGYSLVINLENDNAEVKFEKTSIKKVK